MKNDFDTACRRMVKENPVAFLCWLFPGFAELARHVGWVDTRRLPFPGKTDQTGDLVFEIEILEVIQALWAVALEFQLEPDPDMFGRMLIYLGTLWMERHPDPARGTRYQLASTVVNLTGNSRSATSASFVWPGTDDMQCVLVMRERFLAEESAKDTLEAIAQGEYDRALLPWVPVMAGGSKPAIIKRWRELANGETDERRRGNLGYNALIFAEKSSEPQAWQDALKGWGMVKSKVMEQTRSEGRKEGLAKGLIQGQQLMLLKFLRNRTKQEVPADLVAKIEACRDVAQLDSWGEVVVAIATIDDFRQQTGL